MKSVSPKPSRQQSDVSDGNTLTKSYYTNIVNTPNTTLNAGKSIPMYEGVDFLRFGDGIYIGHAFCMYLSQIVTEKPQNLEYWPYFLFVALLAVVIIAGATDGLPPDMK